jgi:hypothetical protein
VRGECRETVRHCEAALALIPEGLARTAHRGRPAAACASICDQACIVVQVSAANPTSTLLGPEF